MSKTKRTVAALLALATIAGSVAGVAGCHRHAREQRKVEATCTEQGYFEDYCFKCGQVVDRYSFVPALGHDYEGGFCNNCGEPDPNDTTLSEGEQGKLSLTADGTLSWTKLKNATKYELTLTLPNETEATTYEIAKNKGSVKLDELLGDDGYGNAYSFPVGRTFAKFVHYELYSESVDGTQIKQEYPVTEQADEFRIIKRNGKYELQRMGYSDDYVNLNGFYSDVKEDENGEYYLYEVVMEDNDKPQKFNISSVVKPVGGNKAAYYRSATDRANGNNPISSFDMPYQTIPAGASTYYMRLTLAGGGYRDYDLRVYGLKTLGVKVYEFNDGSNPTRTLKNSFTCLEGDIIPCENLFGNFTGYDTYCVVDEQFGFIGKATGDYASYGNYIFSGSADYTAAAVGYGDTVDLYAYKLDEDKVKALCEEYAELSKLYNITQVWNDNSRIGCNLVWRNAPNATSATIPSTVCNMNVLSADFTYAEINTLTVENMYTLPTLSLNYYVTTINLGYLVSVHEGAFVGAHTECVINCAFGENQAQQFAPKWNYVEPTNQYSTKKFTTNYNVQ